MRRSLNISWLLIVLVFCINKGIAQSGPDTPNNGISIYANAGISFYYPQFIPVPSYSKTHLVNPIAEIGTNFSVGKVQISIGLGYYSIIESDKGGMFEKVKTAHIFYAPVTGGVQLFNINKNILHLKGGVTVYFPAFTNERVITDYQTSNVTYDKLRGLGVAALIGLQYKRMLGNRFMLTAQADVNFTLTFFRSDYNYFYFPNNTIKVGVEYFFGKKTPKYLLPSKKERNKMIY
jgi:hypothetical protein